MIHKITFQQKQQSLALALAKMGRSDKVIATRTKLSPAQITYALKKAKYLEDNKFGYRVGWRNGTSEMARKIEQDVLLIIQREIEHQLPRKIERLFINKNKANKKQQYALA